MIEMRLCALDEALTGRGAGDAMLMLAARSTDCSDQALGRSVRAIAVENLARRAFAVMTLKIDRRDGAASEFGTKLAVARRPRK